MKDYKKFFDEAPIALCRTEVKTGKFLMANEFTARLLGYESVDTLLANCRSVDLYPDKSIRQKLVKQLQEKGSVIKELEFALGGGKKIWVRGHLILNGEWIDCYLEDISELVALRDSMNNVGSELEKRIEHYDNVCTL
jgi:PAS domain-containing protein